MTAEVPLNFYFDKEITSWTDSKRGEGMGGFITYEAWVGTLLGSVLRDLGVYIEASCNLLCMWDLTTLLIQCKNNCKNNFSIQQRNLSWEGAEPDTNLSGISTLFLCCISVLCYIRDVSQLGCVKSHQYFNTGWECCTTWKQCIYVISA